MGCVYVCVCERERERECVCVCVCVCEPVQAREEKQQAGIKFQKREMCVNVRACMCVCV